MKKKVLAFMLLTSLLAINAEGQVDQKTALTQTPHGSEFYQYYDIEKSEEGYSGKKKDLIYHLSHLNNVIGELSYYNLDYDTEDIQNIKGGPGDSKIDHYTKPSFIYTSRNGKGRLILDGLIYEFEDTKMEKLLNGEFKIKYIYVPKSTVEDKADKMNFMKRLKYQKKTDFILSTSKAVSETDHDQKIKDYLKNMKAIQKEATENFTEKEKANIAEIKKIRQKKIDEENARWAREREIAAKNRKKGGKAGSGSSDEVIIINETGRSVCLVQGRSSTSFTSKESFDCDEPVYWGVTTDGGRNCTSDKRGIAVSAGQCGKEVVLK